MILDMPPAMAILCLVFGSGMTLLIAIGIACDLRRSLRRRRKRRAARSAREFQA